MEKLTYEKMLRGDDAAVPQLKAVYQLPEVARYISISDNYFSYVTNTEAVSYYKVYHDRELIGAIHLEQQETTLFMDILVFPEFQGRGLGTEILKAVQQDYFGLGYQSIEVWIDERNTPSLRLFEKAGFVPVSKEDELIRYIDQRTDRKGKQPIPKVDIKGACYEN